MKTVLIILTQNDQSNLDVNESLSALMLLASFGISIHVLFKDAGLSLLYSNTRPDELLNTFLKPCKKMVESFEFYDIENFYVLLQDQNNALIQQSQYQLQFVEFNAAFLAQFDHIITW